MAITSQRQPDFDRIIRGNLEDLPQRSSNIISIFLSSTFTDYSQERNIITRDAIPRLKSYCRERGLELEIADMRWGIRDDAQSDHKTSEICLQAIKNSRELSVGPYFVTFLGNKYGYRPFPSTIDVSEFTTLVRAARTACKDVSLLEEWYVKDENSIPATYVLQPITSKYPYYNDESDENDELRQKDRADWSAVSSLLGNLFHVAAFYAFKYKKFSPEQKHKYFRSVTEEEVSEGILSQSDHNRTLCFLRDFNHINHKDTLAWRFTDLDGGLPDQEALDLLTDLRTVRITRAIKKCNIENFTVDWTPTGIDVDHQQHAEYLDTFNETFYKKVLCQIEESPNATGHKKKTLRQMCYDEALHHALFCQDRCRNFCGRRDVLKVIQQKLCEVYSPDLTQEEKPKEADTKETKYNKMKTAAQAETQATDDDGEEDEEAGRDEAVEAAETVPVQLSPDGRKENLLEKVIEEEEEPAETEHSPNTARSPQITTENNDEASPDDADTESPAEQVLGEEANEQETNTDRQKEPVSERLSASSVRSKTELGEESQEENNSKAEAVDRSPAPGTGSAQGEGEEEKSEEEKLREQAIGPRRTAFTLEASGSTLSGNHVQELEMSELDHYTKPLFITGPSGSGKTSLMAKVMKMADSWFDKDIVKIVRFLGTSPGTSSLKNTILGICLQLCENYDYKTEFSITDLEKDFSFLSAYFHFLLRKIDTTSKPLLIVLDSLDQLCSDDYVFTMNWLETRLPPGVMMIISVLPDHFGSLDCAKKLLSRDRFLEVSPLPRDTAGQMLDTWLAEVGRTITEKQREKLMNSFKMCPQPLFLRIAFEDAKNWKSFTVFEDVDIGISVKSAIETLFTKLERTHGQVLVSRSLGYLTVAKNGLSPGEMEDILSLDDEVLQDSYLYHLPASDTHIRLPPLLWKRVEDDLKPYLTVHQADNKDLIKWYHRQFTETAKNRYAKGDMLPFLHTNLADYFMGKWANVVKPLDLYKKKKGSYPFAKRGVPEQPIVFSRGSYNLRKMSEVPHHLTESRDFSRFVCEVCRDLEFMLYKSKTISVVALLNDLTKAMAVMTTMTELPSAKKLRRKWSNLRKETTFLTKENTQLIQNPGDADEAFEDIDEDEEDTSEDVEDSEAGSIGRRSKSPGQDLASVKEEVRYVYEMILLGMDAISRDANNLAIQIIGQLGASAHPHPGLEVLRQAAVNYVASTKTSLIVPQNQCLPTVGGELKLSIEMAICFPGNNPENECKLALSRDGQFIYGIDKQQQNGDVLKIFDLANNGSVMKREKLIGQDIMRMDLLADDRYIVLDTYTTRDKYNPKYDTRLLHRETRIPVPLPPGYRLVSVSDSGALCILAAPKPENKDNSKETRLEVVAGLLKLRDMSVLPLKVQAKGVAPSLWYGRVSPDDKHVVLGCSDGRLYILTADKGKIKHGFGDFEYSFSSRPTLTLKNLIFINKSTFVTPQSGYNDRKNLDVIDVEKGNVKYELKGHNYDVDMLALSKDGSFLASATKSTSVVNGVVSKFVWVWDLEKESVQSVCKAKGPYNAISFAGSRSDMVMASLWRTNELMFWYVGTRSKPRPNGIPLYSLVGHNDEIFYAIVCPNDRFLVTGSSDNTIKIWDMQTILQKCDDVLATLAEPEGEAQNEDESSFTHTQTEKPNKVGEGPICTTSMTMSKDGTVAAVGTKDGWVIFYDLQTMNIIRHTRTTGMVTSMLTSRSGKYILSTSESGVHVWSPKTGEQLSCLQNGRASCIDEAQDIAVVGVGGMEAHGYLYELATGKLINTLDGLYSFGHVAISSDAKKVVSTMFDFPVIYNLDDIEGSNLGSQMDTQMSGSSCMRLSSNDKYVACGSFDGSVRVLAMDDGEYMYRFQHKSSVREVTFSKNASVLLTAGFKNILMWSMKDGSLMYTLSRHQNFINQMKFVCGGRYLVSSSDDKQIVVWDVKRGSSVAHFYAHCPVRHIAVPDDLGSILLAPEHVGYLGMLRPNPIMEKIIRGESINEVSNPVQKAQAFALAFSNQPVTTKASQACVIL